MSPRFGGEGCRAEAQRAQAGYLGQTGHIRVKDFEKCLESRSGRAFSKKRS
jgi:hypothetical protein